MPSSSTLLTLDRAGRRVGDRWLWRRLSLALAPGESLGLAGPSGSGKTLLLRALVGLDRLDEGEVRFRGRELSEWELPRYRAEVVYLATDPALEEGSVEDALRRPFGFRVHRHRRFDRHRAVELLERLGAGGDLLARSVADLSGGEKQRVGFCRALLLEPRVLLLDEPTAHVDPERTAAIEELTAEWRSGVGKRGREGEGQGEGATRACVWTSHDADQLARATDRRLDVRDFRPEDPE